MLTSAVLIPHTYIPKRGRAFGQETAILAMQCTAKLTNQFSRQHKSLNTLTEQALDVKLLTAQH